MASDRPAVDAVVPSEPKLSPRQLSFLALYANGLTMREIAAFSQLAYKTVRNDCDDAKQNCNAVTMTRLLTMCIGWGLIEVRVEANGVFACVADA